jgi:hypothetical protein
MKTSISSSASIRLFARKVNCAYYPCKEGFIIGADHEVLSYAGMRDHPMKDQIENYTKRVRELAEHVRGNEQATKQSLVTPVFTALGYDLTDPRECIPEFQDPPEGEVDLGNVPPVYRTEATDDLASFGDRRGTAPCGSIPDDDLATGLDVRLDRHAE